MVKSVRDHLIKAGVKNLKEYGYPDVSTSNILVDEIYVAFFRSMLNDNLGFRADVDRAVRELLSETEPRK